MAAGRDRADRGLDVARTRAEAEAVAVPARADPVGPDSASTRPTGGPGPSSTATRPEVEARLAAGLRTLQEVAVIPDDQRQRDNQADRAAAAEARQRAAWHRGEAERIAAGRDQLVHTAIADYLAARDDARTIAAGPGLLGRKAHQVEAAQARRDETARRWSEPQPPGSPGPTTRYARGGQTAADRTVGPAVATNRPRPTGKNTPPPPSTGGSPAETTTSRPP